MLNRLSLYDTKSRQNLEVQDEDGLVKIYCCGPTVYRPAHVGNLRTFLLADLIKKTLELNGLAVKLVQNITDVGHMTEDVEEEDKILSQSALEKVDPFSLARKYELIFHNDLALLNIAKADLYPRASESISLMHELIAELLKKNHAYIGSDSCVYFDAKSFPNYGQVSGNRLDALKPGHRYEYTEGGAKRFHADWALWKIATHRTEMIWDSPWGSGFPGWHIECSAMSLEYLGKRIDVHVGGIDLRFPHHENERAQSDAITGTDTVLLWSHGEHLLFEGRKMSKSANNVLLLSEVIEGGYDPLSIRLAFLENRYRMQMDLTWSAISAAHTTLKRWRALVNPYRNISVPNNAEVLETINKDLDTPRLISLLRSAEKDMSRTSEEKAALFLYADKVLGLDLDRQEVIKPLPNDVAETLKQREIARREKNWEESDRLRKILESNGLIIKDTAATQEWEWR
jgi:cysteinyl-tRNA synthetase